jgi:hypothetical protein
VESATLSVTSAVPATDGIDFSVGAPVVLMRGSFREALRKSGTTLANWTAACRAGEQLCPQGLQAAEPLVVHAKTLDDHRRASFDGVAPGRYYLFGLGVAPSGPVVWDLRIELHPGDNTLELDEHNTAALAPSIASAHRTDPAFAGLRRALRYAPLSSPAGAIAFRSTRPTMRNSTTTMAAISSAPFQPARPSAAR